MKTNNYLQEINNFKSKYDLNELYVETIKQYYSQFKTNIKTKISISQFEDIYMYTTYVNNIQYKIDIELNHITLEDIKSVIKLVNKDNVFKSNYKSFLISLQSSLQLITESETM